MDLIVTPGNPLHGMVGPGAAPALPGDKSLSHRAALFGALAQGESWIENFLVSGVTRAMLEALSTLGVAWNLEGTTLRVQGVGIEGLKAPAAPVNCGNSATTLRLLAGALAAAGVAAELDGSAGLRSRPMRRIVAPLQAMGVPVATASGGTAPLRLTTRSAGQPLAAIDYRLPVASAQVKSCLLLAALAAQGPVTLREPGPSRDHTERMLRSMGVAVETHAPSDGELEYVTRLTPPVPPSLRPLQLNLPGDISAAAFLIVAALITPGSHLVLRKVGLNPSRTGVLDALRAMGGDIRITRETEEGGEPVGDLEMTSSALHGIAVSGPLVVRMIDEFPAFAVAAAYASGVTVVSDAEELRHKESDRIAAMCRELQCLGVQSAETTDGFTVHGGRPILGGVVETHGDHRLAMSLAIAGLAAQAPVTVQDAEILTESFPDFPAILTRLGAILAFNVQR